MELVTESKLEAYRCSPTIQSQLPVRLEGHEDCVIDELLASCPVCGATSQHEGFRGNVSKGHSYLRIYGHAICFQCQILYPVVLVCKAEQNDVRVQFLNKEGVWSEATWARSPWMKLKVWMNQIWSSVKR